MLLYQRTFFFVLALTVHLRGLNPVGAFVLVPYHQVKPSLATSRHVTSYLTAPVLHASSGDETDKIGASKDRLRQRLMSKLSVEAPKEIVISLPKFIDDFSNIKDAVQSADVVIIRQEDSRIFNHGLDLVSGNSEYLSRSIEAFVELAIVLENANAILIVVIDGEVRGGGMIFPAMADIVIATNESSFGLPEVRVGMIPSIVSRCLVERMGKAAVRKLSLTGETILAEEAQRQALVDQVMERGDLETYLKALTRRWKRNKDAVLAVKSELLPKDSTHAEAMGTVLGQWLTETPKISDRKVLEYEITDDGVAILTMKDLRSRNTFSNEMTRSILELIPRLKRDSKAIILCSGLDNFHLGVNPSRMRELTMKPVHEVAAIMKRQYIGFVELTSLGIPVIAVINGKVAGGGLPISLWCDYRIATDDVDVVYGNLSRGMSPAGQLSKLLNEYLSPTAIMNAYLTNSHWNSTDLLDQGIVNHVCAGREEALIHAKSLASFISKNSEAGVRDTLDLVKMKYDAETCNREAWKIAKKATNGDLFQSRNVAVLNHSWQQAPEQETPNSVNKVPSKHYSKFPENSNEKYYVQTSSSDDNQPDPAVGIVAMEAYFPAHAISASTLEANGIDAKADGQASNSVWDSQEDSTSLALNAVSRLLENHVSDPYSIGRIEVGTESNIDQAISIKSHLMDLFPANHTDVEGVDNTHACYGGTAALLNTVAWCRETGRYAIVVATDTAVFSESASWRGASAVAMLVGPNPWVEIHRERTSRFLHAEDFSYPRWKTSLGPIFYPKTSVKLYFDSLRHTIEAMTATYGIDTFKSDAVVFHGGANAQFMKMVECNLLRKTDKNTRKSWKRYFDASRNVAEHVGATFTASLFLNLMSLLSSESVDDLREIMLFAYGSGSSATLMHATIHQERAHKLSVQSQLANRDLVSFEELTKIMSGSRDILKSILPRQVGHFYRDLSSNQIPRYERASSTSPQMLPKCNFSIAETDSDSTLNLANMESWSSEVDIKKILKNYGSNVWVVSEEQLEKNLEQWSQLAGGQDRIWYPVKANPSPSILEVLAREGACAECASESELLLARRSGFPADRLIYNSPALDVSLAVKLLGQGTNIVVNSKSILNKLDKELVGFNFEDRNSGRVLVRINPSCKMRYKKEDDNTHLTSHAAPSSKFGIPSEEVVNALQRIKNIHISGLHVHVGTQMDHTKPFVQAKAHLKEVASAIKRHTLHEPIILNLGGGLGIPYNEKEKFPSISELHTSLQEVDCEEGFTYWYEPGQALVGNAVGLLGTILYKETMRGTKIAVADIGSDQLLCNALLGYTHSILGPNGERLPSSGEDKIAGPLCFAGDVLSHGTDISSIDEGDPIFVQHVGAYRGSIASTFNGRRSGGTVVVRNDGTCVQSCPPTDIETQNEVLARDYRWGLMREDLSSESPTLVQTEGRSSEVLTDPGGDCFHYKSAIRLSPSTFEYILDASESSASFCNGGLLVKMAGDAAIVSLMDMLDVKTKDFSVLATEMSTKLSEIIATKKPVSLLIRYSHITENPDKRSYEATFHYSFNGGKTEGAMTVAFNPGQHKIPSFSEKKIKSSIFQ